MAATGSVNFGWNIPVSVTLSNYALAENDWNAEAKRSETRVIHSFGRADQLDRAALQRLVASINRVIDADAADTLPTRGKTAVGEIDIDAVFELGVVLAARGLWQQLGIGEAIRSNCSPPFLKDQAATGMMGLPTRALVMACSAVRPCRRPVAITEVAAA